MSTFIYRAPGPEYLRNLQGSKLIEPIVSRSRAVPSRDATTHRAIASNSNQNSAPIQFFFVTTKVHELSWPQISMMLARRRRPFLVISCENPSESKICRRSFRAAPSFQVFSFFKIVSSSSTARSVSSLAIRDCASSYLTSCELGSSFSICSSAAAGRVPLPAAAASSTLDTALRTSASVPIASGNFLCRVAMRSCASARSPSFKAQSARPAFAAAACSGSAESSA
mmetsp:Transcript_43959/g.96027  ORF Transcript_43959/g.96027 Transcript_43959/m.96027 type:complete len:226 (-) Transcript_43959:502-1179(-)